jgi:hypothetical protein
MLALGVANVASGLVHGFPISSGGSRTVIGDALGARGQGRAGSAAGSWTRRRLRSASVAARFPVRRGDPTPLRFRTVEADAGRSDPVRRQTMRQIVDLPTAVECALRAPSVHNTKPWRWRFRRGTVELHADWMRQLVATDPDRRDLLLSCGARCITCWSRSPPVATPPTPTGCPIRRVLVTSPR